MTTRIKCLLLTCALLAPGAVLAEWPIERTVSVDHYVTQVSSVPSMVGEHVQLYVRERTLPATVLRGGALDGRVVLFVHGAGTPAEVAFDVPFEDYSWMAYLAAAGYDVFSVDMTGYGRSTRPAVMNDPCNLPAADQVALRIHREACAGSHGEAATTIVSDWNDIDRVVDYIRELRGVDTVSLVGWSLGGPRSAGYAAGHAEKIDRIVLLAPAYRRDVPATQPDAAGGVMTAQSRASFDANWQRQVGCDNQYDPAVADSVWSEMLASDPVGAAWGDGIRRAPRTLVWGWNENVVRQTTIPMLLVAGIHDAQVAADRVRDMYADLGAEQKVLLDLGCASHNAMWEYVRLELFSASLEFLNAGTVAGVSEGVVRRGYR